MEKDREGIDHLQAGANMDCRQGEQARAEVAGIESVADADKAAAAGIHLSDQR